MSAKTPAGGVNRKNGRDATVDISESKNVDEPSMFIVQVAAVSCAATHVPESKTANQSFRYTGFRNAAKVEVLLELWFTGAVTGTTLDLLKNQNRLHPGGRQVWIDGQAFPLRLVRSCGMRNRFLRVDPMQLGQMSDSSISLSDPVGDHSSLPVCITCSSSVANLGFNVFSVARSFSASAFRPILRKRTPRYSYASARVGLS
jgi:hypothetical protein